MSPILVTGGTGTLGRVVVDRLLGAGREVRVLSRHAAQRAGTAPYEAVSVDLRGGEGLDRAVEGVDTIVHCATTSRGDVPAARNLLDAARRAGVGHLVYISIVGIDRVPLGYYRTKLEVERLLEASGLGWTVLRTTQFHDLVRGICRVLTKPPVAFVPSGVRVQPIDTAEVAERLVELAAGEPAGRVDDMGGPEVHALPDLVRMYLAAAGRRRPIVPVRLAGKAYRGYVAGGNLTPEHAVGRGTFQEFLGRI
jgi:uncharacterized protein YbjT (DUF2867 family)